MHVLLSDLGTQLNSLQVEKGALSFFIFFHLLSCLVLLAKTYKLYPPPLPEKGRFLCLFYFCFVFFLLTIVQMLCLLLDGWVVCKDKGVKDWQVFDQFNCVSLAKFFCFFDFFHLDLRTQAQNECKCILLLCQPKVE